MTENELRIEICRYLNGELTGQELCNILDIKECPECGTFDLEENWVHHKWDINETEEKACQGCVESE